MAAILSIHAGLRDSAAALFDDDRVVAAVQRERLTGRKKDGGVPVDCVDEVLAIGGLGRAEVSAVVVAGGGPTAPHAVRAAYGLPEGTTVAVADAATAPLLASLFYSDWDEALVCAVGDTCAHGVFRAGRLTAGDGDPGLADLGDLAGAYADVTAALGFRPRHHEGKVTGLAAFGQPVLYDRLAAQLAGGAPGSRHDGAALRAHIAALCHGQPREDAAASIQSLVEDRIVAALGRRLDQTGLRHLGLAGALFANVKLNQRVVERCGLAEVFVLPPMGDEGLVIGGALQHLLARDGWAAWTARRHRLDDVYWGRDFTACATRRLLAADPAVERLPGAPAATAARLLAAGHVVAIFSQRMEFGPRALGARSILAAPQRRAMTDTLNRRLDRSDFMPFAPVVAEEHAAQVFDVSAATAYACRFMTVTCAVKPDWVDRIPAVVHIDGTARPQIVRRRDNPLYHDILGAFLAETGVPVLVNTSFNAHEHPIVNTPEQAAHALVAGRVDYLVTDEAVFGVRGVAEV